MVQVISERSVVLSGKEVRVTTEIRGGQLLSSVEGMQMYADVPSGMYLASKFCRDNGKPDINEFRRERAEESKKGVLTRKQLVAAFAAAEQVPEDRIWYYDHRRKVTLACDIIMNMLAAWVNPSLEALAYILVADLQRAIRAGVAYQPMQGRTRSQVEKLCQKGVDSDGRITALQTQAEKDRMAAAAEVTRLKKELEALKKGRQCV